MVFITDERVELLPGQFSPLDCWAMGLYARELLLQAHASPDPAQAAALARRIGVDFRIYRRFPRQQSDLGPQARRVCALINPLGASARPGLAAVASGLDRPIPEIRALFAP